MNYVKTCYECDFKCIEGKNKGSVLKFINKNNKHEIRVEVDQDTKKIKQKFNDIMIGNSNNMNLLKYTECIKIVYLYDDLWQLTSSTNTLYFKMKSYNSVS